MADFIELATWSHDLLRRHLSSLEGKSSSDGDNDDFVVTTETAPSQYGYHDPANPVLYDPTTSAILGEASSNDMTGYMAKAGARPFFSKTAESELYLLATNFLLYVAMVIITVMVAKIYFPESLQRGRGNFVPDPASPRKYSYVRSEGGGEETSNNNEVLDSDDDEEEDGEDEVEALISGGDGNSKKASNARTTFLDFDPERTSKNAVFQRLMFCSIMLNVTFVAWGVLQVCLLVPLWLACSFVLCSSLGRLYCRCLSRHGMLKLLLTHVYLQLLFVLVGTHVDATISSLYRRLLYVFVCSCIYQSVLDHGVEWNPNGIFEATNVSNDGDLRVYLSFHFQHAEFLVSIRSSTLCELSSHDAF
jgi:hypothetical protein